MLILVIENQKVLDKHGMVLYNQNAILIIQNQRGVDDERQANFSD
jgi:hypothetical protein